MRRVPRIAVTAAVACLFVTWAAPVLAEGSLEGRWLLVEQTYGKGRSNLAPLDRPVRLEFTVGGSGLVGKVWAGPSVEEAARWPAVAMEGESSVARIEGQSVLFEANRVRADYVVRPTSSDNRTYRIIEEYEVADDGRSLQGTVTVQFLHAGEPRGSYVLNRRFAREP